MSRTLRVTLHSAPSGAKLRRDGLESVRDEVHAQTVTEAFERGRESGRKEAIGGAVQVLQAAAARLDAARERAEQDLPREVVELAVEIADQLLRVRLADGAYDLERMVRNALAGGCSDRSRCVVHVHPKDLAQLEGVVFREDTSVVARADLAPGTVHVETRRGLLVRDPLEALAEIREALLEGLV